MTSKKLFLAIMILIIVMAAALRIYRLGEVPHGLYIDEAAMLLDAKSVSQSGLDMHGRPWYQVLFPSYGDFKLPVYIWLASISVTFFGATDWALRLPSVIAGLGSVIVSGAVAVELLRKNKTEDRQIENIRVWTMLTIAISPWSIMFSRTGFEGHVGQFLVGLSVWIALYSRKHSWLLPVAAIVGGLATYSYFSVRFVWPVIFVVVSVLYLVAWPESVTVLRNSKKMLTHLKSVGFNLVLPLVLFGLMLLPMLKSPLYADSNTFRLSTQSVLNDPSKVIESNVYRELAGNTVVDRFFFHRFGLTTRALVENIADHASLTYIFERGDSNERHGTGRFGLFLIGMLPGMVAGVYYLFTRRPAALGVVGVWWIIALVPASVPEATPHALRSLNALIPMAIIIGVGLAWLMTKLSKIGQCLIGLVLVFNLMTFAHYYFTEYRDLSAPYWQEGYAQTVHELYKFHNQKPIYVQLTDDKFYIWMLAYGPMSVSEIHKLKSNQFIFKELEGFVFDEFTGWGATGSSPSEVVIVGTPGDLSRTLIKTNAKLVSQTEIHSLKNKTLFVVAVISQK